MGSEFSPKMHVKSLTAQQIVRMHQLFRQAKFDDPSGNYIYINGGVDFALCQVSICKTKELPSTSTCVVGRDASLSAQEIYSPDSVGSILWVENTRKDHACWERPEDMDTPRIFKRSDPTYSKLLARRAIRVFQFADKYRGAYSNGLKPYVCTYYWDFSFS
ncbi:unnamed protein product [Fraxinus pennsylvanica]|uniref:Uncharacterized protein n=1 Tax=Fraxinus pennsylvanica TaxID=56036 RepID=A0AAD2A1N4_9LAMI|nr:unnamed protein product [Fraxinus pennsylvanica]